MKLSLSAFVVLLSLWITCCSSSEGSVLDNLNPSSTEIEEESEEMPQTTSGLAAITAVTVTSQDTGHTFSVTISSPDLGCIQYADWWEIIDLDGNLVYRRILAHSHVDEQPFTRSGGPVIITDDTEVYIRAHMNTTSYGSQVFKGNVANGFTLQNLDVEFAKDLETTDPLPANCAF